MRRFVPALVLGAVLAPPAIAGEAAFDAQRARQLRILKKGDAAPDVRLHAVKWISQNIRDGDDTAAAAAIEIALKDPDPKVRASAVEARFNLAVRGKGPCPVSIVAAMLDADPAVRSSAINWSGAFPPKRLSQDAAPVLLRCLESPHRDVRDGAVILLGELPKIDPKIVQALRTLVEDKDSQVAHDARSALFRLTGDFAVVIPYSLRFRIERRDAARIQTGKKLPAVEQARRNLFAAGIDLRLHNLAEERPGDFARYLVSLLGDDDAGLRRATALYVADVFREAAEPPPPNTPDDPVPFIGKEKPDKKFLDSVPPFDGAARQKAIAASAKKQAEFRDRLQAEGLTKRLTQLRTADADPLVRGAAAQALHAMDKLAKLPKTP